MPRPKNAPLRSHSKRRPGVASTIHASILPRAQENADQSLRARRAMLADVCRVLGLHAVQQSRQQPRLASLVRDRSDNHAQSPHLSPRMRQTLDELLAGSSEKEIAARLGLSRHTIHVYVKALYRGFEVNSRGELLARFVHSPRQVGRTDTRFRKMAISPE
jgi:DNA-binding NarL/FixJ family response regulator